MKKMLGVMTFIFILFAGGIVACDTININRIGKDNLYVQIGEYNEVEETELDSGQVAQRYWYELPAFDKNGEMIVVELSADKELRIDAYLMLYIKKENEVTSYKEVEWEDIPVKAQEKLEE